MTALQNKKIFTYMETLNKRGFVDAFWIGDNLKRKSFMLKLTLPRSPEILADLKPDTPASRQEIREDGVNGRTNGSKGI